LGEAALESSSLVSVVTPFHNTRDFLAECIESVLAQTYLRWEYLLVDNQSDDGSSEIARRYAERFPARIRLVHTSAFLSQVQNYNFALSMIPSDSKYCKMVQADDRIFPQCLERLVALAESDASIGLVSSYRMRGTRVAGDGLPDGKAVVDGAELCRLQLSASYFTFGSPTTVLYRSEIVRQTPAFFDESTLHDDTDACYRILRNWKFGFVNEVLSFNRIDNDSVSSRARDFNPQLLDRFLQLHKFGPFYFEPEDLSRLFKRREREYYTFLARRLLGGSGRAFWRYHASGLKSGGLKLNKARLVKHAALELLRALAHPIASGVRLYQRFRLRAGGTQFS
jgi:glycosyltransferase involved in cell wall biosynthesis